MKRYLLNITICLAFVLATYSIVNAQANSDDSVTNYEVGECVENRGQLWQQLADGTWADENSDLNTCNRDSLYERLYSNRYGEDDILSYLNLKRLGYYPWGTNYPGGYDNYQDYFLNCVLAQSLVSRKECQIFPKISDFYLNPYGSSNSLTVGTVVDGTYISAKIPLSKKIASAVKSIAMGWSLGQIFN